MKQNFASLNLTDSQLTAVDNAIAELESQLSGLVAIYSASSSAVMAAATSLKEV